VALAAAWTCVHSRYLSSRLVVSPLVDAVFSHVIPRYPRGSLIISGLWWPAARLRSLQIEVWFMPSWVPSGSSPSRYGSGAVGRSPHLPNSLVHASMSANQRPKRATTSSAGLLLLSGRRAAAARTVRCVGGPRRLPDAGSSGHPPGGAAGGGVPNLPRRGDGCFIRGSVRRVSAQRRDGRTSLVPARRLRRRPRQSCSTFCGAGTACRQVSFLFFFLFFSVVFLSLKFPFCILGVTIWQHRKGRPTVVEE